MEKNRVLPISVSLVNTKLIFLGLALLSFVVPFSLGHPQLLVGTIVNAALFLSVVLLPGKLFLPIIILPSLGVLSRGLIFGPFTPFLLYFIPFIWLSNLSLVLVFKKSFPFWGYFLSAFLASFIKLLILFSFANLFFRFNLVPRLFLTAMGFNQLITACLGGFFSFLFSKKICHGKI